MQFYFELPNWVREKRKRNKILLLGVFALNLIFIFFIWWNSSSHYYITNPAEGNFFIALGRLTGLLMQFTLIIQVILISRIVAIEQAFGFDKMNRIHRLIGEWIIVFLVAHPLLLTIGNAQAGSIGLLDQFSTFLADWQDVWLAFIGSVTFAYVASISYVIIRKKLRYETWYFIHLLTYVAIVLVFFHETNTGDLTRQPYLYYWYAINYTTITFVILYRLIKPLWNTLRFQFRVARVVMETKDTYSVYITGKNIEQFMHRAGQYANITFLQKGLWYTHPFSFSIQPNASYIRFTMKALGDYTKRLGELKEGTRVIIDGPLGLFIESTAKSEKLLLIAGGIGITPIRALIGELVRTQKNFVLLYAARTVEDIAFRSELEQMKAAYPFSIFYILSAPLEGYESGFLDREKIVRLVPDFFEREVFLCGPPPMMDATVKNLEGLGIKREHIHFEKFSF